MNVRLDWRGDEVKHMVHAAERSALSETAEAAVRRAKTSHPGWKSVTGEAEASIRTMGIEEKGPQLRARFGSTLPYFIFLEVGSRGRAGDSTLRRAADVEGGHLRERIAKAIR